MIQETPRAQCAGIGADPASYESVLAQCPVVRLAKLCRTSPLMFGYRLVNFDVRGPQLPLIMIIINIVTTTTAAAAAPTTTTPATTTTFFIIPHTTSFSPSPSPEAQNVQLKLDLQCRARDTEDFGASKCRGFQ